MEDLRNLLTQAGLLQIKTYIQSGNLVYQSLRKKHRKVWMELLKKQFLNNYKFEVPVINFKLNDLEKPETKIHFNRPIEIKYIEDA